MTGERRRAPGLPAEKEEKRHLLLFVAGSNNGRKLRQKLEHALRERQSGPAEIEIVNILADPDRACDYDIIATPTIVRLRPQPAIRVIGNLADIPKVMSALEIPTRNEHG